MRLVDAQRMHAEYPRTFQTPSASALEDIGPGDCVKIAFADIRERLWVLVKTNETGTITGTLDNDTVSVGLSYGDTVTLEPRHVLDILPRQSAPSGINRTMETVGTQPTEDKE